MATEKNKPIGYFEKFLALDCETTGLAYNTVDPSFDPRTGKEYQAVSWGLIVANAATLKPIESLYVELKWNGTSEWSPQAEKVHGLSKEHLEQNGVSEEEATIQIASLILKHWGPDVSIRTLGHNHVSFDLFYLRRLMEKSGIHLKFGNRHIDMSSIGFVNWSVFTSDQLFDVVGFTERGKHNALDDAMHSLEAARRTRIVFQKGLALI